MLRYLIYLLPILFAIKAKAQNLVSNGSFEEYHLLPNAIGQINYCKNWFSATNGSPDFLGIQGTSGATLPLNGFGYQMPFNGNFHSGIYIYNKQFLYGNEYIESKLISELLPKEYCVSFYVSLADSASSYTVNNIGAYFSADSIYVNDIVRLTQFTPQIINIPNNPLTDKTMWVKIFGTFLAQGGEKYITIGNFNLSENDDTVFVGGKGNDWSGLYGYIYIDSITVTLCDDVGIEEKPIDKIDIYPNPTQDFVNVEISGNYKATQLNIYNLTGQLIYQKQLTQPNEQIPIPELGNGMYIFVIQNEDRVIGRHRVVVAR